MVDEFERFQHAQRLFEQRRFAPAAKELEAILASDEGKGRADVRELHLRSLYHSAQLTKAEAVARAIIAEDPADAYAVVVLGRTLYRQRRYEEAEGYLRRAEAFGISTV